MKKFVDKSVATCLVVLAAAVFGIATTMIALAVTAKLFLDSRHLPLSSSLAAAFVVSLICVCLAVLWAEKRLKDWD